MELTAQFTASAEIKADWLIVGVWEDEPLTGMATVLDTRLEGVLSRLRQSGDISGKVKEITPLLDRRGIAASRLLVVGLGKRDKMQRADLLAIAATAARAVTSKAFTRIACALPDPVAGLTWEELAALVGAGLMHGCEGPGLRKTKPDRFVPQEICLVPPPSAPADEVRKGVERAAIEGQAVMLACRERFS